MRAQIGVQRSRFMTSGWTPDLKRALELVPVFDRAVREVSTLLQEAGICHALAAIVASGADRKLLRTAVPDPGGDRVSVR